MTGRKLAFVLPSLHGGGAERAAVRILNALPRATYDLTLYLFAREGACLDEVSPDVHVIAPAAASRRVGRLLRLRRFLAREHFHAVVSFLSHFTVYGAVRASRSGAKYVISQQTPLSAFLGDADYHWRKPSHRFLFERVARVIYPRADLVIAASTGVARDLIGNYRVRQEQLQVIPNPVNVEDVMRRSVEPLDVQRPHRPTIVTAGRLAEAKNLPLLVDALQLLAQRLDFRAWILGEGELEAVLRERLRAAGLDDRVRLLGFQSNPWKYMAAADVFVLTSHYEGFGNVLIEAMAAGTPVVATASVGTRDIVRHGENGLLVEQHEPAEVASAIEALLSDPARRDRLASTARAASRDFEVDLVAKQWDNLFERLCA